MAPPRLARPGSQGAQDLPVTASEASVSWPAGHPSHREEPAPRACSTLTLKRRKPGLAPLAFPAKPPPAPPATTSRYCHTHDSLWLPRGRSAVTQSFPSFSLVARQLPLGGARPSIRNLASCVHAPAGEISQRKPTFPGCVVVTLRCSSASPSSRPATPPARAKETDWSPTKAKPARSWKCQPWPSRRSSSGMSPIGAMSFENPAGRLLKWPTRSSRTGCRPSLQGLTSGTQLPPSGRCMFGWQSSHAILRIEVLSPPAGSATEPGAVSSQVFGSFQTLSLYRWFPVQGV
mmetsp:Transcript_54602/g.119045  ORF Transcript_54602/g.119045 Transcript_54602/m.119045 type:complete len:290 (-) Transcript_54602:796-1665(-)